MFNRPASHKFRAAVWLGVPIGDVYLVLQYLTVGWLLRPPMCVRRWERDHPAVKVAPSDGTRGRVHLKRLQPGGGRDKDGPDLE